MPFPFERLADTDNRPSIPAVDNVLERFVALNQTEGVLTEEQILRVATDQSKVNVSLQHYTINARVGGDMNENNRLVKQAQDRVEKAKLVFTTCAGEWRPHSSEAVAEATFLN